MPKYGSYPDGAPAQATDKVLANRGAGDWTLTLQELLAVAGLLSSDAPAALTDALAVARAGAAGKLTVLDLLAAAGLVSSGAPAALTDVLLANRANVAKTLTPSDLLTLFLNTSPYQQPANVLNGAFRIAQRGPTTTLTNAMQYGSLDGWCAAMSGTAAGVLQQQASSMLGINTSHRARLGRTAASASTGTLTMASLFETIDVVPLQGQTITFSWDAAAGAQFSASGGVYKVTVWSGTGVDEGSASYYAGTWTGQAAVSGTPANKALTPGGNSARHSITVTIPSTTSEIALEFSWVPTGTAGADDALYLGRVKYDFGSIAAPPVLPPIAQDLLLCQRRLPTIGLYVGERLLGFGVSAGNASFNFVYKARARAAPTGIAVSANSDWSLYNFATAGSGTPTGFSLSSAGVDSCNFSVTTALTVAAGAGLTVFPANTSARLLLTGAEL